VKLSYRRLDLQLAYTWTLSRGTGTNVCKAVVVKLIGADGTVGLGEAAPNSRYKESVDTVQAFLQKVDARGLSFNDVEGSMTYLDTISHHDMSAKCAVNIALLDGAAQLEQGRGQSWVGTPLWAGFPCSNLLILRRFRVLAGGRVRALQEVLQHGDGSQQDEQCHGARSV